MTGNEYLLAALRNLRKRAKNNCFTLRPTLGICSNVGEDLRRLQPPLKAYDELSELDELFSGWSRGTGWLGQPIPYHELWKWEGEQLELRLSLLSHMISKLEAIINDEVLCYGR